LELTFRGYTTAALSNAPTKPTEALPEEIGPKSRSEQEFNNSNDSTDDTTKPKRHFIKIPL
jgi:hypothetical protein